MYSEPQVVISWIAAVAISPINKVSQNVSPTDAPRGSVACIFIVSELLMIDCGGFKEVSVMLRLRCGVITSSSWVRVIR